MKRYVGKRISASDTTVTVVVEGTWLGSRGRQYPLPHHLHHSPDGFQWGYGGSGPAELARCILWDHLEARPDPACYQDFKNAFLVHAGDDLELIDSQIATWLIEWRTQNPTRTPSADDDAWSR